METLQLKGLQRDSTVYLGESIDRLSDYIPLKDTMLVVDRSIYPKLKERLPDVPVFTIMPGEYSKSVRVATLFYRWLQEQGATRRTFIVGVGGGSICDLAGFVASTYMRGIGLGLVPTTLLAQVDASLGGKNALNLYGFKNIVGTFYQPEFSLLDYSLLQSLSSEEINGGLAELIKHSMITDAERFAYFDEHATHLQKLEEPYLSETISWSLRLKARLVEEDEFDRGVRRKLNFGHTWGHAVEGITNLHHGYAVAMGMVFATKLAVHRGLCDESLVTQLEALLKKYSLPTHTDVLPWVVFKAMQKDKKREGESINFILPHKVGEVTIERISFQELHNFIEVAMLS